MQDGDKRLGNRVVRGFGTSRPYFVKTKARLTKDEIDQLKAQQPIAKAYSAAVSPEDKTKVRLSHIEKEFARLHRKNTLYEIVADQMVEAIHQIPELEPPQPAKKKINEGLDEEEIWCDISDCQIGSMGSGGTGGLASYNYEKFVERLYRWRDAVLSIIKYHPNPIKVLDLAFLGDIIEGSTIFESQIRQVQGGAVQQVLFAAEHLSRIVNELTAYFKVINCFGVVGNHGRIGKKGVNLIMDNLDYLLYKLMEERLKSNPKVKWSIPDDSFWMVVERMGQRHLLIHGDRGVRGWGGIPFYGVKRYRASMHELLRNTFDIKDPFEYVHLGHFSQLAHFDNSFMNGSWDAGTELSVAEMVSGGLAYQWMLALHPVYGVSSMRRIWLLDAKDKPPMKIY